MTVLSLATRPNLVDRVIQLLQRVDYRRAETSEDREAIFRLRYNAYLREGAISPNRNRIFTDPVDDKENTWIFGVYIDGELTSSIRLSVNTPGDVDIPSFEVFSDILGAKVAAGHKLIDPTRFVTDHSSSRRYPELPYVTLRLPWSALEYFRAHFMLAAVRSEHQAFYKRLWGHRALCPPRPYPNLKKPISLMALDYLSVRDRVHRRYPFFQSNFFERRMLFERHKATRSSAA